MSQDHFTQLSQYAGFLFLLLIRFHGSCLIDIVTSLNLSDKAQELTKPSVSYPSFLKSSFLGINSEDVNVEIILYNLLKGSLLTFGQCRATVLIFHHVLNSCFHHALK